MTQDEFARLKDAPVPQAREEAKRAALTAALATFDNAEREQEKIEAAPQGMAPPNRQKNASPPNKGAPPMRSLPRFNYALAASLAAMVTIAPTAWLYLRQHASSPARYAQMLEEVRGRLAPSSAALNAPAPVSQSSAAALQPTAPAPTKLAATTQSPARQIGGLLPPIGPKKGEVIDYVGRSRLGLNGPQEERSEGLGAVGHYRNSELSESGVLGGSQVGLAAQSSLPRQVRSAENARRTEKVPRDKFAAKEPSPVKSVAAEPVSTFSLAVDTASYAFARRMVNAGRLPPKDSVRAEEFINYFPYSYPQPESADTPFKPTITITPSPWNAQNRLVHVAVQGYSLKSEHRPRANLVLLIDVSGSMTPQDRLPLVKNAFRLLVDELQPEDTVGIVTYANGSGVALEPTKVAEKDKILAAIAGLGAGGSTAGAQGILDAYRLAEAHFDKDAVNRIVLSTDGDFNVGVTDPRELQGFIERKRKSGIFLSILGVGQDNYNDALMQKLAQHGNGVAAYVDTLNEARKVLVEQASSTLFPIAKDVKIQMEWNPSRVAEYRLIGYETRNLRREDFNNDEVAAGNVGSGLAVTAIYEITPVGAEKKLADDLRYGKKSEPRRESDAGAEFGFLKLRYKLPKEENSRLISLAVDDSMAKKSLAEASDDVRFSIAAAAYAQLLEGAPYLGGFGYDEAAALAQGAKGEDRFGYRAEFVNLVRLAKSAQP